MAQDNQRPKVLIVGAGPAGLTLALSLLRQGISVRIIEKNVAPNPGQRGSGIYPRTLEVLESLGLYPGVQKLSIPVPKLRIYKLPGGVEVATELDMITHVDPTPDRPLSTARFLGQNHLESLLTAAILENGGTIDRGVEFRGLEQADGLVKVTLAHSTSPGTVEEATFQYVVGADGGRGLVRKAIDLPFVGETHEDKQVVFGDFYMTGLTKDHLHTWGEVLINGAFVRATETPGLFSVIMSGDLPTYIASPDKLAAARQLLKEAMGGRDDVHIVDTVWQGIYRFNIRMTPEFSKGRVFLVGDAGHVHSPTGGQGLNTGVQDSYNLGWKLALVLKGQAPPILLESYTAERIPVVSEMLNITTQLFKKTVDVTGRNPSDQNVLRRGGVLNQFGVNYRTSAIVLDDGDEVEPVGAYGGAEAGDVRAGDRAPDASGLERIGSQDLVTERLFELFDSRVHTVLVFADRLDGAVAPQTCVHTVGSKYPADLVRVVVVHKTLANSEFSDEEGDIAFYQDKDGHADRSYRSSDGSGKVFVVRPDGYVGARLASLEGVERYFEKIFG